MLPVIGYILQVLSPVYPQDEARAMALWLVEEMTGKTRSEILLSQEPMEIHGLDGYLRRLVAGEPIQYLFGKTEWMGMTLRVTRDTLIPRPETGELVEWLIQDALSPTAINGFRFGVPHQKSQNGSVRLLDIGTGSGCIAIALKKRFPAWEVTGWDVSEAALRVARENAARNGAAVRFEQVDILSSAAVEAKTGERRKDGNGYAFDVVVSNPPYVMEKERAKMAANVLRYEPETALFVSDDDPLLFYRAITRLHLAPHVYFEINEQMGEAVRELLQTVRYDDAVIHKDSYGKDRMARGKIIDN